MKSADDVRQELKCIADLDKAKILQQFFKTGPGQYVEDDIFVAVIVPQSRQAAKKFSQLPLGEVRALLYSCINEERLVALLILACRYASASSSREKVEIVKFYLESTPSFSWLDYLTKKYCLCSYMYEYLLLSRA